jgi:hypothetical protein
LVDGGRLNPGNAQALQSTLRAALMQLDAGKTRSACKELQAFLYQVDALVRGGQLTTADGQELRDTAIAISTQLNC